MSISVAFYVVSNFFHEVEWWVVLQVFVRIEGLCILLFARLVGFESC